MVNLHFFFFYFLFFLFFVVFVFFFKGREEVGGGGEGYMTIYCMYGIAQDCIIYCITLSLLIEHLC